MFSLLRQLFKFWFVLMLTVAAVYLLVYNQDRIYVNLPGLFEGKVPSAIAFLLCFMLGASTVTFYFAGEIVRKSWHLRRATKRIRILEQQAFTTSVVNRSEPRKKRWFMSDEANPVEPPQSSHQEKDLI